MYVGIDAGSISAKLVIIDDDGAILFSRYSFHHGKPVQTLSGMLGAAVEGGLARCRAVCATGSGRDIIGRCVGAELVKNEITATWRAAVRILPGVSTCIEIGGQDSKLLSLRDGEIESFKLNSVCAAGTGSFIEQQAARLGLSIEELSGMALRAEDAARFTGRCTVFVETEMVNLQQRGHPVEAIAAGLFDAICENFLNDLGPGMRLLPPFMFCGGVASIEAVRRSFEKRLGAQILVPGEHAITAAYGAALLALDHCRASPSDSERQRELPRILESSLIRAGRCESSDCLSCGGCLSGK